MKQNLDVVAPFRQDKLNGHKNQIYKEEDRSQGDTREKGKILPERSRTGGAQIGTYAEGSSKHKKHQAGRIDKDAGR